MGCENSRGAQVVLPRDSSSTRSKKAKRSSRRRRGSVSRSAAATASAADTASRRSRRTKSERSLAGSTASGTQPLPPSVIDDKEGEPTAPPVVELPPSSTVTPPLESDATAVEQPLCNPLEAPSLTGRSGGLPDRAQSKIDAFREFQRQRRLGSKSQDDDPRRISDPVHHSTTGSWRLHGAGAAAIASFLSGLGPICPELQGRTLLSSSRLVRVRRWIDKGSHADLLDPQDAKGHQMRELLEAPVSNINYKLSGRSPASSANTGGATGSEASGTGLRPSVTSSAALGSTLRAIQSLHTHPDVSFSVHQPPGDQTASFDFDL